MISTYVGMQNRGSESHHSNRLALRMISTNNLSFQHYLTFWRLNGQLVFICDQRKNLEKFLVIIMTLS